MTYGEFADVYDQLMDDYDYDAWAKHYLELIGSDGKLPSSYRLTECACGTGNLTIRFAAAGCRVTGIDLSPAMLRCAEKKARSSGVPVSFVQQDMRKLKLGHRTDALLCTCDGLNYLLTREDVTVFFKAALEALKPGGIFCFDISSQYKLEQILGNSFQGEERDGLALLWQNRFDEKNRIVTMDVTFFVREEDGKYRRFREEHRQRAHSRDELFAWLQQAGFEDIRVYGEYTMDSPREKDTRLHFRAVKPEQTEVDSDED